MTDAPDAQDVDPSKYLVEDESLRFSKTKLYRLHWGYGLSIEHIGEISELKTGSIRDRFQEHGIPMRSWSEHLKWEPHHGIPPMYEWPHGHDRATPDWADGYVPHQERSPEAGGDD